jgi:hypothetical protein
MGREGEEEVSSIRWLRYVVEGKSNGFMGGVGVGFVWEGRIPILR